MAKFNSTLILATLLVIVLVSVSTAHCKQEKKKAPSKGDNSQCGEPDSKKVPTHTAPAKRHQPPKKVHKTPNPPKKSTPAFKPSRRVHFSQPSNDKSHDFPKKHFSNRPRPTHPPRRNTHSKSKKPMRRPYTPRPRPVKPLRKPQVPKPPMKLFRSRPELLNDHKRILVSLPYQSLGKFPEFVDDEFPLNDYGRRDDDDMYDDEDNERDEYRDQDRDNERDEYDRDQDRDNGRDPDRDNDEDEDAHIMSALEVINRMKTLLRDM